MKTTMNERIELNAEALDGISGGKLPSGAIANPIRTATLARIMRLKRLGKTREQALATIQANGSLADDKGTLALIEENWDKV